MSINYAYKYAIIELDTGFCVEEQDTSLYVLSPDYVPIPVDDGNYLMKYYWPIPEVVNSFDDFQGDWWYDEDHTIPFVIC